MKPRELTIIGAGLLCCAALSACQSTQARSAELAAKGGKLVKQKAIDVGKASTRVDVLETAFFTGESGTSVVAVELRNNSDTGLINVPIQLDVRDAKGNSLFRNDTEGTDPSLTSVAVIEPGAEVWWVHDSVFSAEKPAKVEVKVGEAPEPFPDELPEFEFEEPELVENASLGLLEANGAVETSGSDDIRDVYFYGVALKGDKVVAAGRAAVDRIKPDPKFVPEYNIFLTGDPQGAKISVNAMPTFFEQ